MEEYLEDLRWGYKLYCYLYKSGKFMTIAGVVYACAEDGRIGEALFINEVLDTENLYYCKSPTIEDLISLAKKLTKEDKFTIAAFFTLNKITKNKGDNHV